MSNGLAESSVKIVKNLLRKCLHDGSDPYLALVNQRNTSKEFAPSPANLLFSRNLNNKLPVSKKFLKPKLSSVQETKLNAYKERTQNYFNMHTKTYPELSVNDSYV